MKYDPVNKVWYDHTPEEWAARHPRVMSLPASVAARLKSPEQQQEQDPVESSDERQGDRSAENP